MEKGLIILKAAVAVVLGALSTLLGGWDVALQVLVVLVVLDYISGVVAAFHRKEVSSYKGFWGIVKKIMLFVPVAVATMLDIVIGQEILRNLAIWFYIANEGISILENLGKIGVLVPPGITDALEQLKSKGGK
ncbi:MAG TPA: phage holin family protein [Oscillospiraceae bacterium]|nr:phage holin family protein [Oscillospiraceae bacterium]